MVALADGDASVLATYEVVFTSVIVGDVLMIEIVEPIVSVFVNPLFVEL